VSYTAKQEEKRNIAKKLIDIGLDNSTISQTTDLTIEQIEQLRSETKE
jgi:hypothetical protein